MRRRTLLFVAAVVCAIGLLGWAAASGPSALWHAPSGGSSRSRDPLAEEVDVDAAVSIAPPAEAPPADEPLPGGSLVGKLLAALGILVVAGLVLLLLDHLRRGGRPRLSDPVEAMLAPEPVDVADHVTAAAVDLRVALAQGTPRNGIVACWVRLEDAVVASGIGRAPAETSSELTVRVLRARAVDPDALARLAALYREARFSTHELDEPDRARAVDALDGVLTQLGRERGVGGGSDRMNRWIGRAVIATAGAALVLGAMIRAGMDPNLPGLLAITVATVLVAWVVADVLAAAEPVSWLPPYLPSPPRPADARVARIRRTIGGAGQGGAAAADLRLTLATIVAARFPEVGRRPTGNRADDAELALAVAHRDPEVAAALWPDDRERPLSQRHLALLLDRIDGL